MQLGRLKLTLVFLRGQFRVWEGASVNGQASPNPSEEKRGVREEGEKSKDSPAVGGNHTVGCPLLCADGETVFPNLGSSSQQMSSIEVLECAPTLNQLSPVTSV